MRNLLGAFLIASVLPRAVLASNQCMIPSEKIAFDVRALQTQMMIAAITCNRREDYNQFVWHHQSDLTDAYDQITAHFARVNGTDGQAERDAYITDIANAQSQTSHDPNFCRNVDPLLYQASTLQTTYEMSRLVTAQNVISTYPVAFCEN